MSTLQRRTLWRRGRSAWEAWAKDLLEKRRALEEAGLWSVNWFGEGENAPTAAWLEEAAVDFTGVEFGEKEADFSGFVFPGPANFQGARFDWANFAGARFTTNARFAETQFRRGANFAGAVFSGFAEFDDAVIASDASFEGAQFVKQSNGPLAPSVRFTRASFGQKAEFRVAKFAGDADFKRCRFLESVRFDEAEFGGEGQFAVAQFGGLVSFCKTRFALRADFSQAQLAREARFSDALFSGAACFDRAHFGGETSFREARFTAESDFVNALFDAETRFDGARFGGRADFKATSFGNHASFRSTAFDAEGRFRSARFLGDATFTQARFKADASFAASHFAGAASFSNCAFAGNAVFDSVTSDGAFILASAYFTSAPAFHEAVFRDPPRLDDIAIADPLQRFRRWRRLGRRDPRPIFMRLMKTAPDPELSSRYRRLRRLAADAHDHHSEQAFFADELRCRRFWLERPFGKGAARFWLGWLYGGVSDFGRSLLRPFAAWLTSVAAFALLYLNLRPGAAPLEALERMAGPGWPPKPLAWNRGLHWVGELFVWAWRSVQWTADTLLSLITTDVFTTGACVQGGSTALGEAIYLSLKNGLLMVQWDSNHAAHRVFGCLYGVNGDAPITPLSVSVASLIQTIVSAALVFLFLLAFRNLLKAK